MIQKKQDLPGWNNTEQDYPKHLLVQQLFEQQVERTPDACALIFQDQRFTYRELNTKANQLAHYLCNQGATPKSLIGLHIERSSEMVVAMLAILKCGAGYLPLDPKYPESRLQYMARDAAVEIVLTQATLQDRMESTGAKTICVDELPAEVDQHSAENLSLANIEPAQDLAYVIYTSGSTGKPKGIQVTHRNVVNFLCSMAKEPGLAENDTLAAVTTISFDIHVLEIFLTLSVGATLLLVPDDVRVDGQRLAELLQQNPVTAMQATPATWRLMFAAGWAGDSNLKAMYGGEAMSKELLTQLLGSAKCVWNLYGPTEATVWCTCKHMTDPEEHNVIGRPIANLQTYVLDDQLQPLPMTEPGELCVAGDGIALGYLNKPELTAEVFVDNPFTTEPGQRLYRTGDIAKYREDGELILFGRKDHQVKVRGFRIELGEIESALRGFPEIDDAVVIAKQVGEADNRIVAYVIAPTPAEVEAASLRNELSDKLPEYMLPSFFVRIESLPLTPNGKLDRKQLPNVIDDATAIDDADGKPETETETQLFHLWREALEVSNVSMNRTFHEQGGTSLLVMQLAIRTEQTLGVRLSPRAFNEMTLREMAKLCDEKRPKTASKPGFFARLFGRSN